MRKVLLFCWLLFGSICTFATKTTVTSSTTLGTSYTAANDGDTLLLAAGSYNNTLTLPVGKRITLRSANSASLAIFTGSLSGAPATAGSIVFDSIDINRGNSYFIDLTAGAAVDSIIFKNCIIRNINRCLIRTVAVTGVAGGVINNVTINGSFVKDCGKDAYNFMYFNAGYLKSLIIKNNTFWRYKGESLFSASLVPTTPIDFKYLLQNNTLFKFGKEVSGKKYGLCQVTAVNIYSSSSVYNISNNIISLYGIGTGATTPRYAFIVPTGSGTITADTNLVVNYPGFSTAPAAGWTETNTMDLTTFGLTEIAFTDTVTGDFTLPARTPFKTAGKNKGKLGDPRWILNIKDPASLAVTISPQGAGSVSPPKGDYERGTEVTIAATRNFGYKFKAWKNGDEVISTSNPLKYKLDADYSNLTAEFESINTYAFTLNKIGSFPLITVSPSATNGRYEEGTIVSLSASSNDVTSFNNWENGSTYPTRTITVTKDTVLTATFDNLSVIAAWDFNQSVSTVTGNRLAEYYNTNNTSTKLRMFGSSPTVNTTWGNSTVTSGGVTYNCARRYTDSTSLRKTPRFFQIKFNGTGYKNITVNSKVTTDNYCVLRTQKLQYTTDTTKEWIDLISIDLTPVYKNYWASLNGSIPELTEDEKKAIYVRWFPDTTSSSLATYKRSNVENFYLANIIIKGDTIKVAETDAPVLVSSVPASNAASVTVSINGAVVLTFNEQVISASKTITLGGKAITGFFGTRSITFKYSKLTYDTEYTLSIPEGSVTDLQGNPFAGASVTFKTCSPSAVSQQLFDAVVAADGTGSYLNIKDAIAAAPESRTAPWLIFIKNGTYKEHIEIPSTKPFIHLIGQLRDGVIIADTGYYAGSSSSGAIMYINAPDCYLENITIENTWGKEQLIRPSAIALYTPENRFVMKNTMLIGYQRTYRTTGNAFYRHYLQNCQIEGAVDYIVGSGDVFLDSCNLKSVTKGGTIVLPSQIISASWGYVFNNCSILGNTTDTTYLGRPGSNAPKAVFLNTTLQAGVYPKGWYYKGDTLKVSELPLTAPIPSVFADYNTKNAEGSLTDLSSRIRSYQCNILLGGASSTIAITGNAKSTLTANEATQYNYENVIWRSTDEWDPKAIARAEAAPTNVVFTSGDNNLLSWQAVDNARLYVISRDNNVIGFTTATAYKDVSSASGTVYKYEVQSVSENGALSANVKAESGEVEIVKIDQTITIKTIADKKFGDAPFTVTATASPSLNTVTFSILSGAASLLATNTIKITGAGKIVILATQNGDVIYNSASKTYELNVSKAASSITWATPAPITYGVSLSSVQLNASASGTTGNSTYSPALGAVLNGGLQTLSVKFEADDNYMSAEKSVSIEVNRALSTIVWENPANLVFGNALSENELNAEVIGTTGVATYDPALGTKLNLGTYDLSVVFAADQNYQSVSKTVQIKIVRPSAIESLASLVKIYPNPVTNGILKIESQLKLGTYFNLTTLSGVKVTSQSLLNSFASLDMSDLPSGVYLLQISSNNQVITKQIIKQ